MTTVSLSADPILAFTTAGGAPLVGGTLLTQVAGTNYPTYSDAAGTIQMPNPIVLNSRGEVATAAGTSTPLYVVPSVAYTFTLSDALGNPIWTAPNVTSAATLATVLANLTQQSLSAITTPRSAAESTANVTPTNYFYPVCCVDRYGTNLIPGTTDMTAAWNAALAVAKVGGGEVSYGITSNYLVTSVIDCTVVGAPNQPGILIRGSGVSSQDANFGVLAKHALMAVFDCTGNDSITFENVSIKTDVTVFPQVGILTARNATKGSVQTRLYNCKIVGRFGTACYYNYGSEDDVLVGCYMANYNSAVNTKVAMWTANNVGSVTSIVAGGIATGALSCIDHNLFGNQFLNATGSGTTDCIYLEQTDSFKLYGGWAHAAGPIIGGSSIASAVGGVMTLGGSISGGPFAVGQQINGTGVPMGTTITSLGTGTGGAGTYNISTSTTWGPVAINAGVAGRALIYVNQSNAPSNFCVIHGLTGEVGQPVQNYGIFFSNDVQTPQNWRIDSCKFPNGGFSISAGANVTIAAFNITNVAVQGGYGINFSGTVQDSRIDSGYTLNIGTSLRNALTGDTSSWTIATRSKDSWNESGTTNRTFAPGVVTAVNGWTAVGAITQRGKLCYNNNKADFTIVIGAATTIACSAGATIALPFTSIDTATATVFDAFSGVSLGSGIITGSTLTLPVAITATAHTVVIEGYCFVS